MRQKNRRKGSPANRKEEAGPPRNPEDHMSKLLRVVCDRNGPVTEYDEGIEDDQLFLGLQEWLDARGDSWPEPLELQQIVQERWPTPRRRIRAPYRPRVLQVEVN